MNLPTLYSRTSTGAIQQWTIFVEGDKFRVESGQVDGKKVLNDWTICEPKNIGRANSTTADEQALSEAQAKWDKKVKTGYSTDINNIDACISYVEPMLAKDLDDYIDKIDFSKGVIVQNKYNGVRCVATLEAGEVVLKSRKGEFWISVPHINKDFELFFNKFPDAVLDGELYNYDLRQKLNELTKLVRKTKNITPKDLVKSEQMVCLYIYDGFGFGDESLSEEAAYLNRKTWINEYLPKFSRYYRQVEDAHAHSMSEVDKIYEKFLNDGEEGAIIRLPHTPYERKRSKNLLKYKPEDDAEALIIDILEGAGNWAGTAKMATIKWQDKVFEATFKGSHEDAAKRLKDKHNWIGKEVTFLYTGLTGLGTPNYARIDPDNCFK